MVYASSSLDPLPANIRHGMISMGIAGLLSTLSTLSLFLFLTYRMVYWRRYYQQPLASNQIFVLIYNLLLADFQQALSFIISFHWIAQNKLVGPSTVCFAQGWLIQIGDVSSGMWVLAIAVHTFISLVGQRTVSNKAFVCAVVALWMFCLILTAVGPIINKHDFFVPAGAWCWINATHQHDRLYLHYLWIFTAQLGSLVIYIYIFFFLRHQLASSKSFQTAALSSSSINSPPSYPPKPPLNPISPSTPGFNPNPFSTAKTTTTITTSAIPFRNNTLQRNDPFAASRARILKTARYMVVYPITYVALTLPLASARISAMAGRDPPTVFFPVAGTLMACCGVVDVILYLNTRKALVKSSVGHRGMHDSEHLTRFRSADTAARRRAGGDDSMILDGMSRGTSYGYGYGNGSARAEGHASGTIMVEREVVMSDEGHSQATSTFKRDTDDEDSRRHERVGSQAVSLRSDSMRSFAETKGRERVEQSMI